MSLFQKTYIAAYAIYPFHFNEVDQEGRGGTITQKDNVNPLRAKILTLMIIMYICIKELMCQKIKDLSRLCVKSQRENRQEQRPLPSRPGQGMRHTWPRKCDTAPPHITPAARLSPSRAWQSCRFSYCL